MAAEAGKAKGLISVPIFGPNNNPAKVAAVIRQRKPASGVKPRSQLSFFNIPMADCARYMVITILIINKKRGAYDTIAQ